MGFFKKLFGIQDKPKADFLNSSVRMGETKIYNIEEKTVNIDEEILEIFHYNKFLLHKVFVPNGSCCRLKIL